MDETRLLGASPEILGQFESLIRRDRNHPSVILWSLGNEEMGIQHTEVGIRIMRRMQDLAHRLDPSRPVTYATNMTWVDICDVHAQAGFRLDVFGANQVLVQTTEAGGEAVLTVTAPDLIQDRIVGLRLSDVGWRPSATDEVQIS